MSYTWLPVDANLLSNHKTARLARSLKCSRAHAVGHLVCLWSWALVHAPDGVLSLLEPEDVATAAEWDGDADLFLSSLVRAGFLDDTLILHDWEEHQGANFRKRLSEADRKRKQRDKCGTSVGQVWDDGGTENDDRTGQDRTIEEGLPPLVSLALREIESESSPEAYQAVIDDHLKRGLSMMQIEATISELADWWPTHRKTRKEAHRTLRVWLGRKEPEQRTRDAPTPYIDYPPVTVPEGWGT
jgi:hypothetical protein